MKEIPTYNALHLSVDSIVQWTLDFQSVHMQVIEFTSFWLHIFSGQRITRYESFVCLKWNVAVFVQCGHSSSFWFQSDKYCALSIYIGTRTHACVLCVLCIWMWPNLLVMMCSPLWERSAHGSCAYMDLSYYHDQISYQEEIINRRIRKAKKTNSKIKCNIFFTISNDLMNI